MNTRNASIGPTENWTAWPDADKLRLLERLRQLPTPGPQADDFSRYADDPLGLARDYWPGVRFYDKQVEILETVRDCPRVFVPAGHQLGKDYVGGFCSLWGLLAHPVSRVITTSVADHHLRVLWAEINRFIQTCRVPLAREQGGPLIVNHRDVHKVGCPVSYMRGLVSERGEGMAGHHAPFTLCVMDECSGIDNTAYERADTWARRMLCLGNCYPSNNNFFEQAVKGGDILAPE